MTNYEIVTSSADGDNYIPISAKTDEQARKAASDYAGEHPDEMVFCSFMRSSDGQRGYINRDGASPTGSAY